MPWLVLHDVDAIQGYVFGTPRLREIRGASALADYLNRVETKAHGGDAVIYASGGSAAAAVADEDPARRFLKDVAALFPRETRGGATSTGVLVSVQGDGADASGFREALEIGHRKLRAAKAGPERTAQALTSPYFKRCQLCGIHPAAPQLRRAAAGDTGDPSLICPVCYQRDPREAREDVRETAQKRAVETLRGASGKRGAGLAWELSQIGASSEGYLSVVYVDGNRMGERLARLETPEDLRGFSAAVDEGTLAALLQAVGEQAVRRGLKPLTLHDNSEVIHCCDHSQYPRWGPKLIGTSLFFGAVGHGNGRDCIQAP